jgi:2-oxoglutarate ferredoxin oxidoreductase subunit alpha
MEDELASIAAALGASWGGTKAMTATSGPGFSLMMENLGLGIMTETPCVLVNVQRGGPSTGLPTAVGHGDMMQARWGTHGHYEIIALCPNSPQEFFDLTILAFNLAETYRTPVLIMADEIVGHMTEKVVIPEHAAISRVERRHPSGPASEHFLPYATDGDGIPPMVGAGDGYAIHITGLTHNERGYPAMDAEAQAHLVGRLVNKIRRHRDEICLFKEDQTDDADVVVIAYGIVARMSALPIQWARDAGLRVGLFRPITVWPFPEERVRELAGQVRAFVVPELNLGQIALEVERCAAGKAQTILVPHAGGGIHDPATVFEVIRSAVQ